MDVLASNKNGDNRVTLLSEKFVLKTVDKAVNTPKALEYITEHVLDSHGIVAQVAALVKSEKRRFTKEQTKIDAWRQRNRGSRH